MTAPASEKARIARPFHAARTLSSRARPNPVRANIEQALFGRLYGFGSWRQGTLPGQNVGALEVSLGGGPEPLGDLSATGGARPLHQFFPRPDIEESLDSLRVGVFGGVEPSRRVAHVPHQVIECLDGYCPEGILSEFLAGPQIDPRQGGVVVQHFLEVGDQPLPVHRIAGESSTQLIEDPACGHPLQGEAQHGTRARRPGFFQQRQEVLKERLLAEFGRSAEPAVCRVEGRADVEIGLFQKTGVGESLPGGDPPSYQGGELDACSATRFPFSRHASDIDSSTCVKEGIPPLGRGG